MGMMDNLPTGWTSVPLKDIATVFLGKTPARSEYCSKGKYKVIKFRDLKSGHVDFSNAKDGYVIDKMGIVSSLRPLQEKDVLITSAAHSGENIGKKCAYIKRIPDQFEGVFFTGELLNIRAEYDETLAKWSYLYFLSAKGFKEIQSAVKGVHLTSGRANMMQIDIAPLSEQRRIVAKLEKLLQKVDACKERLDKIPTILKRFRQSILAAACSGQLTQDLDEGKRTQWKETILGKITSELITDPFGSTLHKSDYIVGGIPVINPVNIVAGKIGPSPEVSIDNSTYKQLSHYALKSGDIIIARRGEMGRCAVVTSEESGWLCGTGSIILRLTEEATPMFAQFLISSPNTRAYLSDASVGTTMDNLNQKLFKAMPILLPSIAEQHEIVRRVEALFKIADQIEKRYKKARAYVGKLTQSILAKAFRGELVPQDPNDEPASELLKRIKEERMEKDTKGNLRSGKQKRAVKRSS